MLGDINETFIYRYTSQMYSKSLSHDPLTYKSNYCAHYYVGQQLKFIRQKHDKIILQVIHKQ